MKKVSIIDQFAAQAIQAPASITGGTGYKKKCPPAKNGGSGSGSGSGGGHGNKGGSGS